MNCSRPYPQPSTLNELNRRGQTPLRTNATCSSAGFFCLCWLLLCCFSAVCLLAHNPLQFLILCIRKRLLHPRIHFLLFCRVEMKNSCSYSAVSSVEDENDNHLINKCRGVPIIIMWFLNPLLFRTSMPNMFCPTFLSFLLVHFLCI